MQDFLVDLIYANPKPNKALTHFAIQIHFAKKLRVFISYSYWLIIWVGICNY